MSRRFIMIASMTAILGGTIQETASATQRCDPDSWCIESCPNPHDNDAAGTYCTNAKPYCGEGGGFFLCSGCGQQNWAQIVCDWDSGGAS
jgi:hypothetical protein